MRHSQKMVSLRFLGNLFMVSLSFLSLIPALASSTRIYHDYSCYHISEEEASSSQQAVRSGGATGSNWFLYFGMGVYVKVVG